MTRLHRRGEAITAGLQPIEDDFAHEQLELAAQALGEWLAHAPAAWYSAAGNEVMREVARQLQEFGYKRPEYLLLGLHTLTAGLVE